jgi:uncharacterized membrane protein
MCASEKVCPAFAGRGRAALLVAVFPANLYLAMNPAEAGAASIAPVLRWGRHPLQIVLIWWPVWCTRPKYVVPANAITTSS